MSHALPSRRPASAARKAFAVAALLLWGGTAVASNSVYKWVDASGVTYLSSDKPPAGVQYERVTLATTSRSSAKR